MRGRVWGHRFVVAMLAAWFGWLLPAHHHAPGAHAHAHPEAGVHSHADADHHDDAHHTEHAAGHHDQHDGDHAPASDRHGDGHCDVCHAARTLYTPVAVALPVLAPENVCALKPVDADRVVSLRIAPVYRGRAPPAGLI